MENNKRLIYLGCGHHRMKDFIHVEINLGKNKSGYPDILADITDHIPLPDNFADLVYSCDTMEHLTYSQFLDCLLESRRILKPGGYVRILTPDLDKFVEDYQNKFYEAGRKPTADMPNENYVDTFISRIMYFDHRYDHTFDTLKRALEKAGFDEVRRCQPGDSKVKEANSEILAPESLHPGELIVEARKSEGEPKIKKTGKKYPKNPLAYFLAKFLNIKILAYTERKARFPQKYWFIGLFFNKLKKHPWAK